MSDICSSLTITHTAWQFSQCPTTVIACINPVSSSLSLSLPGLGDLAEAGVEAPISLTSSAAVSLVRVG
jgi:hypothetical protein